MDSLQAFPCLLKLHKQDIRFVEEAREVSLIRERLAVEPTAQDLPAQSSRTYFPLHPTTNRLGIGLQFDQGDTYIGLF